jgi:foldase protein PrsA
MNRFVLFFVAAMSLAGRAAIAADDLDAGPVVIKGKGVEIRRGQMDDAFIAYRANLAARGQSLPEARRELAEAQLADRMIVTRLLVLRGTPEDVARATTNAVKFLAESRRNADSEEAFLRHLKSLGMNLAQFTNRVMEQAISEEVVTRELKRHISVADEQVSKFYETNSAAFAQPELARASQILVSTREGRAALPLSAEQRQARKEKAEKILERAKKGEDFAKLAEELSDDPSAKENKGEYRFARAKDDARRAMVPEFEKVAFNLQPGQISDLVTTDYGYHIIKLHEIIPAQTLPLEKVRQRIKDHLLQAELEKQMTPYFAKLKKEAGIEILDEKLRTTMERLEKTAQAERQPQARP